MGNKWGKIKRGKRRKEGRREGGRREEGGRRDAGGLTSNLTGVLGRTGWSRRDAGSVGAEERSREDRGRPGIRLPNREASDHTTLRTPGPRTPSLQDRENMHLLVEIPLSVVTLRGQLDPT